MRSAEEGAASRAEGNTVREAGTDIEMVRPFGARGWGCGTNGVRCPTLNTFFWLSLPAGEVRTLLVTCLWWGKDVLHHAFYGKHTHAPSYTSLFLKSRD